MIMVISALPLQGHFARSITKGTTCTLCQLLIQTRKRRVFCVGDRVLSINGARCAGRLQHEVVEILQAAEDAIELHVVHDHATMHSIAMRDWEHASKHAHEDTHTLHHLPVSRHIPVPAPASQAPPNAATDPPPTMPDDLRVALAELQKLLAGARAVLDGLTTLTTTEQKPEIQALVTRALPPVVAAVTALGDCTMGLQDAKFEGHAAAAPCDARVAPSAANSAPWLTPQVVAVTGTQPAGHHSDAPIRTVTLTKIDGSFGVTILGLDEDDEEGGSYVHTLQREGTGLAVGDVILSISGLDMRCKSVRSAVDALSLFSDGDTVDLEVQHRLADSLKLEVERLVIADAFPRTVTFEDSPHLKKRTQSDLGFTFQMFSADGVAVPFFTTIVQDGVVATSGEITVGDMLLGVNGVPTAGLNQTDVGILLKASIGDDLVLSVKTHPDLWTHVAPTGPHKHTDSALVSKLEPTAEPRCVVLRKGTTEQELGFRFDGPIIDRSGNEFKDIVFIHKVDPTRMAAAAGLENGDRVRFIGKTCTRVLPIKEIVRILMTELGEGDTTLIVQNDIEKFRWRQERLDVRDVLHLSHLDKEGEHRLVVVRKVAVLTPFIGNDDEDEEVKGMPELGFTMYAPSDGQNQDWYVRTVKPDSLASHYGLRRGHRIVRVNNSPVSTISTLQEFHELVKQDVDKVALEVVLDERGLAQRWKTREHVKLEAFVLERQNQLRTITVKREDCVFPFSLISPAALHGYDHREATYVHHLQEKGSAWKAGLQVGDLVVSINGEDCLAWTQKEVDAALYRAFDSVTLVLLHDWNGYSTEVLHAEDLEELAEVNAAGGDLDTVVLTGDHREVVLQYSMYRNFGFKVLGPKQLLGTEIHDQHHVIQTNSRAIEFGLQVADFVSIDGDGCHTMTTGELRARLQEAHDSERDIRLIVARDIEGAVLQHDHEHRLAPAQRGTLAEVDLMVGEGPLETVWQAPGPIRKITLRLGTPPKPRFAIIAPQVPVGDDPMHDRIHVHRPSDDAQIAGLREGDQLISINGFSCQGFTYDSILFGLLIGPGIARDPSRSIVIEVVDDPAGYEAQKHILKIAGREGRDIKDRADKGRKWVERLPIGKAREDAELEGSAAHAAYVNWVVTKVQHGIGDITVRDLDKESARIRTVTLLLDDATESFGVSTRGPEVRDGTDIHDRIYVIHVNEAAAKAGLRVDDQLLYINGSPCYHMLHKEVVRLITMSKDAKHLTLGVIANTDGAERLRALDEHNQKDVWASTLTEGELVQVRRVEVGPDNAGWYGFTFMGPHEAAYEHRGEAGHSADNFYVVAALSSCGLKVGDLILSIDGEECSGRGVDEVVEQIAHHRGVFAVEVQRSQDAMWEFASHQTRVQQDVRVDIGADGSWGFDLHYGEPSISAVNDDTAHKLAVTDILVASLLWQDATGRTCRILNAHDLSVEAVRNHLADAAASGTIVLSVLRPKGVHHAIALPQEAPAAQAAPAKTPRDDRHQGDADAIRRAFQVRFPHARDDAAVDGDLPSPGIVSDRLHDLQVLKERTCLVTPVNGKVGMQLVPANLKARTGALVNAVTASGAAEAAGIRPSDQITGVNGTPCETTDLTDIQVLLRQAAAGLQAQQTISLKVRPSSVQSGLKARLSFDGHDSIREIRLQRVNGKFGVTFSSGDTLCNDPLLDAHFVREIKGGSALASGLQVGDRVISINGIPCGGLSLREMVELLATQRGDHVTLAVVFDDVGYRTHSPSAPLLPTNGDFIDGSESLPKQISIDKDPERGGYQVTELHAQFEESGLAIGDVVTAVNGDASDDIPLITVERQLREVLRNGGMLDIVRKIKVRRNSQGALGLAVSNETGDLLVHNMQRPEGHAICVGDQLLAVETRACAALDGDGLATLLEAFPENAVEFTVRRKITVEPVDGNG
eukprot:CAMPEP_0206329186 /NCGR_PEP_ID=MMETSP0106_2-20121207/23069_1 /ASSEMBLY_ACC=CAM_ASM_000206 /TAXON_ID=81532 /ORGANISM="Acanthoeca-like sp., Strain 10tr" /LENGTH=1914 /DNA_ID=CAMNT_0053761897 /DNA_START=76 /DNA_END=5821 /DNA_ORIENTATION=-